MVLNVAGEEYYDGWIDYPGVGKITDSDVADYVIEHTTLFDRIFRPRKVIYATILSEQLLMGVFEKPKKEVWKF